MDPSALLRPGLLDGRVIALGAGPFAPPLAALGAIAETLPVSGTEEEAAAHARAALTAHGELHALVLDLRPAFGSGGVDGLRRALDGAWVTIRAVAVAAWIEPGRPGRVLLVAPPPNPDDPSAEGLRAGAENVARTLSIEWARHGITTVAITPGARSGDGELAALLAYLASPAGDYFSGARLALGESGAVAETPSAG